MYFSQECVKGIQVRFIFLTWQCDTERSIFTLQPSLSGRRVEHVAAVLCLVVPQVDHKPASCGDINLVTQGHTDVNVTVTRRTNNFKLGTLNTASCHQSYLQRSAVTVSKYLGQSVRSYACRRAVCDPIDSYGQNEMIGGVYSWPATATDKGFDLLIVVAM